MQFSTSFILSVLLLGPGALAAPAGKGFKKVAAPPPLSMERFQHGGLRKVAGPPGQKAQKPAGTSKRRSIDTRKRSAGTAKEEEPMVTFTLDDIQRWASASSSSKAPPPPTRRSAAPANRRRSSRRPDAASYDAAAAAAAAAADDDDEEDMDAGATTEQFADEGYGSDEEEEEEEEDGYYPAGSESDSGTWGDVGKGGDGDDGAVGPGSVDRSAFTEPANGFGDNSYFYCEDCFNTAGGWGSVKSMGELKNEYGGSIAT
ncbi:hypothetical protein F4780DRAFT_258524 [Xylariomycetidae sp. FL0641]|nr:hypothetical protein F4780DRAFT_258524 [Xylariomycetidae sp. FL0641]